MTVLEPAGFAAHTIAGVAWSLFIGSLLIFTGVMALLAMSLRRHAGAINARHWIIGGGIIFPAIVLCVLMSYTAVRSAQLTRPAPANALVISVTAKMWWWEVRYRLPDGGQVVLANEIHIPVGYPVVIGLSSTDVIHSFWVPQLAGKMDMVPGRTNQLQLSASAPGVYRGQCAEYCGEQHARMAMHVVVHETAAFDAWLAAQARPASVPTTVLARAGQQAFEAHRCTACHTVRGIAVNGRLGPDLTHVGSRLFLGAGTLRNEPGAMPSWLAHVQTLKAGARMPAFDVSDAAGLAAIGAYLEQLK